MPVVVFISSPDLDPIMDLNHSKYAQVKHLTFFVDSADVSGVGGVGCYWCCRSRCFF